MYCVSCKNNTVNTSPCVTKAIQNRLMLLSDCAVCGKENSTFIKNQEASRLEFQ